jgi:hypothetical protein
MKYQLEGTMYNNHLCDQYMKYQLEGTLYSCTDHSNGYCTLVPLVGISCTDHTNGYCTLVPLIGISCTDHTNGYCTLYLSDQYMKYQLEGTM